METKAPTTKRNMLQIIEASPASQLPAIPEVAARFKNLYQVVHGKTREVNAFYEAERFHFMKMINESEQLKICSKLSLYGCFLDVAVSGLSFDPSFKHLYLVPFNINVGTKNKPVWEKRAQLQIGGPGELLLRIKQGQVKYTDNPTLVYEGDEFNFGTKEEKTFVNHTTNLAKRKDNIVACYMKIVRIDDTVDYKIITQEDMARFKKFSKDPESKAWTIGIGGLWQSKCIKHAFKNYPKVRVGKFSELATQTEDKEIEVVDTGLMQVPDNIDYDMVEMHLPAASTETVDTEFSEVKQDNDFMDDDPKQKKATSSVRVDAEEEEKGF